MPNTIHLKGDAMVQKEGEASAAITPGQLIEFGGINDLQRHSTAGGTARKAFALENDLIGDPIGTDYAVGATVKYGVFPAGSEINALLDGGENASIGDALISSGDGNLAVSTTEAEQDSIVAYAMEAVDNSATSAGGTPLRIRVEAA